MSKHKVFYRAIHSINIASFTTDIITSDLVKHPKEHASVNSTVIYVKTLLDKHAPIKYNSVTKSASQMTPKII